MTEAELTAAVLELLDLLGFRAMHARPARTARGLAYARAGPHSGRMARHCRPEGHTHRRGGAEGRPQQSDARAAASVVSIFSTRTRASYMWSGAPGTTSTPPLGVTPRPRPSRRPASGSAISPDPGHR